MTASRTASESTPDLRDAVLGELVERAGLAQRGEVAPQAPLREQPEGAVHRGGPQPDQVRAPAQPFADRAILERRAPTPRDQVAAGEVGEHARVDAVGLAGQRRDRLDLARVGDLDRPAARGEAVAHPHARRSSSRCSRGPPGRAGRPAERARPRRPGSSPSVSSPLGLSAHHAARRVPQSIPRYCMCVLLASKRLLGKRRVFGAGRTDRRGGPRVLHDSRSARCRASRRAGSGSGRRGRCRRRRCAGRSRLLKRSSGLVERSLRQCEAGNA